MPTKNELFLKFTDYCSKQYDKVSDKTAFMNKFNTDSEINRLLDMAEREDDYEKCRDLLKQAVSPPVSVVRKANR